MRQIVLDTETTGIGHESGHRIIEIGGLVLVDRKLTEEHFHVYLNPEREVDEAAFNVHGISTAFLQDKPLFKDVVDDFLMFIKGAELIIHNAPFDVGFLNAELQRLQWPTLLHAHCSVLDTLVLAREKHPGQRNNLDALCKRYDVDRSHRQFHGALLDAELLARVYLAMTGGQTTLFGEEAMSFIPAVEEKKSTHLNLSSLSPVIVATEEELARHDAFLSLLATKKG